MHRWVLGKGLAGGGGNGSKGMTPTLPPHPTSPGTANHIIGSRTMKRTPPRACEGVIDTIAHVASARYFLLLRCSSSASRSPQRSAPFSDGSASSRLP